MRRALPLAIVLALVALAIVGPWLAADPAARDLDAGLTADGAPLGPSAAHWLGTDPLGRDVLARVLGGARLSLAIAGGATLLSLALGTAIGLVAGTRGGRVDALLMRAVELVLAFPALLVAILLAALLRQSAWDGATLPVIVALAAVGWTTTARVVRVRARAIAGGDYALAARALGASPARIAARHVLPNLAGTLAAYAATAFAQAVLAESTLGFLGLGPPPPAPSWGRMLYEGRAYYRTAPHLVLAPAIAIVGAVLAWHVLAGQLARSERR